LITNKKSPNKIEGGLLYIFKEGVLEQSEMAITIKMKTLTPPPILNIKKF
jgi:hypothetical protein